MTQNINPKKKPIPAVCFDGKVLIGKGLTEERKLEISHLVNKLADRGIEVLVALDMEDRQHCDTLAVLVGPRNLCFNHKDPEIINGRKFPQSDIPYGLTSLSVSGGRRLELSHVAFVSRRAIDLLEAIKKEKSYYIVPVQFDDTAHCLEITYSDKGVPKISKLIMVIDVVEPDNAQCIIQKLYGERAA